MPLRTKFLICLTIVACGTLVGVRLSEAACSHTTATDIAGSISNPMLVHCVGTSCTVQVIVDRGVPIIQITCQNQDQACVSSYTTTDPHGACQGAFANCTRCVTDGTYNVTTYSGGACHFDIWGVFKWCDAPTPGTPTPHTNKAGEDCTT